MTGSKAFFFEKKKQKTFARLSRSSPAFGTLGWVAIVRLGVVNAALGAVVALVTFTLNRVMTVELALPALLPGTLVALHYAAQLVRPRLGFGSDRSGRRTPFIVGGLAALASGGMLAAVAVAWMASNRWAGVALAVPAYVLVGAGAGAVGTSSLALMAVQVAPGRRPAAATIFWVLMILGVVVTAGATAHLLHPFSWQTLVRVAGLVSGIAFLVGTAAIWRLEATAAPSTRPVAGRTPGFAAALRGIWHEPASRRFAIFVFVSMLAYSAQELILEPFAGTVFGLDPARTAGLTGLHNGGVLCGMLLVAIGGSLAGAGQRARPMRLWTMGGCAASAACLAALAGVSLLGQAAPLRVLLLALGVANGVFAVSAIGAMLGLAGNGGGAQEGVRLGVWGAAQAVAMGLGGLASTGASDLARLLLGAPNTAYAAVFCAQAALFLAAAALAKGVFSSCATSVAQAVAA